jgi:formyltetrahydrofolate synthetase
MGPNGSPMPTIRLENFRDGLEDYAYYCILQKIVEEMQKDTSKNAAFIAEANKALEVPKTLVRAANDSTADSEQIYQWRRKVADLIEKSGMSNINPWGSEFNVRGFTK